MNILWLRGAGALLEAGGGAPGPGLSQGIGGGKHLLGGGHKAGHGAVSGADGAYDGQIGGGGVEQALGAGQHGPLGPQADHHVFNTLLVKVPGHLGGAKGIGNGGAGKGGGLLLVGFNEPGPERRQIIRSKGPGIDNDLRSPTLPREQTKYAYPNHRK